PRTSSPRSRSRGRWPGGRTPRRCGRSGWRARDSVGTGVDARFSGCRWDALADRRDEPVADAADGLDRRPVRPELAANLADMDVDRPCLAREVRPPDVLEQHIPGQHDAGVAGQCGEQVELAGAKAEVA